MTAPIAPTPLPGDVSSEALLRSVLDVSLTGFMLFRPVYNEAADTILDFVYEYLNPAAQQMLHLPQRPSESFLTRYPMAGPAGIFDFYREAFLVGQRPRQEFNYQSDGLDGYFHLAAQRQGPLLVVSFTDTNDQPRSVVETALRESQAREQAARAQAEAGRQRFYDVLLHLPALVAVYEGPELVYTFVNETYQQYFPAPVQLFGRPLREVLPEAEAQGVVARLERVYHTGEPYYVEELEVWLDHSGGGQRSQQVFLNLLFHPLRNAQGQVTGVLDYSYDITAQVQARRQVEHFNQELEARVLARTADLQESEGRFRTMADAAPAMLWVTDPDGQCTYLNAQWYQYTGQTEAEALGMGWTQAVHPEEAEQARQKFLIANAQRANFYFRYRLRRHDGVYRWAVDAGHPHFTEDGAYAGIVGTVIDIHEQQLAEDELHATNAQLTRTNIDLDTFVYTASHDLKAPISNIEGIALALHSALPAEVQQDELVAQLFDLLRQTVARFQFTIGQLTDLSKLQLAHAGPAEPVNVAAVVESVCLDLASVIIAAKARLTLEVAPDLVVSFSPGNLRSAIYNLLSNAIKYRALDRPAQIRVGTYLVGQRVVLEIADNGLGLNAHQQQRLFGLFQRLHTHVEGTGVGLYITKRLVENGGGTIAVESQVDVGTTFTLTFPA